MFADLIAHAQIFFLIAARVLALIETAPLLSSESVPQIAKVALAGFCAFCAYPAVLASGYAIPDDGLMYAFLVIGEALIGLVAGFFLTLITSAFGMAGQLFSLQMGLSASETFDPLAQEEVPLMGQFLNLMAMLIFLCMGGMPRIFSTGIQGTFAAIKAVDLVTRKDQIIQTLLQGMGGLFLQALVLSFPILGTLFLVSITTGLLSKAAPQMNLLTEGFPLSISVAYILLFASMPFLVEAFSRLVDSGFTRMAGLLAGASP